MTIQFTEEEKLTLEKRHRTERDGRIRDRIKAVLLKSENWTNEDIAQALRIHPETVSDHIKDWQKEKKLKPENGGSVSLLTDNQAEELDCHLQSALYTKVSDICSHVKKTYGIHYSVSGMTKWLKIHRFSYKHPKKVPAKADPIAQKDFVHYYEKLRDEASRNNEPLLFLDAAHPTMATKVSYGWIKKGSCQPIAQTASRTRVNVLGALNLSTMQVVSQNLETINSETIAGFFSLLRTYYPRVSKIHIILDQAGYHRSETIRKAAAALRIELHFLPVYSPNLNLIERLWKIMNEYVRNNVFFENALAFRKAIGNFFENTVHTIKDVLRQRITDNFQTLVSLKKPPLRVGILE